MKTVLKILAGVLVLLLLGVIVLGLSVPRFEYTSEVRIDRPPLEVWAVFANPDRMKEWMPGLESIEAVSGGPMQVGSEWKLVFLEDGEKIEVLEKVTDVRIGELFAFDLETDPFTGHTRIELEPDGEGTTLVAVNEVEGRNLLWAAALFLGKGVFEQQSQETYELLAEVCEGSGT